MRKENPFIHESLGTHDEAHELFKRDPEEFERRARALISKTIEQAPERNKQNLIRIQHSVDNSVRKVKNPLARANIVFASMCSKLNELNDNFKGLQNDFKEITKEANEIINPTPKLTVVKNEVE